MNEISEPDDFLKTGQEETDSAREIPKFPPKPQMVLSRQNINQSLFSLLLFIAAFYLIFRWNIQSIFILMIVIMTHELGHYLAMKAFHYQDLGIFFIPFIGAFTTGTRETISQKQRMIILLSGPIPGILLGIVFFYLSYRFHNEMFYTFANLFFLLNLFNLLPIMPLDGGKILKGIFFEKNEIIETVFLLLSVGLLAFIAFFAKSYFLLVIPLFLLLQLRTQSRIRKMRNVVKEAGIDISKSFQELDDREYWIIRDILPEYIELFGRYIIPRHYVVSPNENRIISQIQAILQTRPRFDLKVFGKILIAVVLLLNIALTAIWIIMTLAAQGVIHLS